MSKRTASDQVKCESSKRRKTHNNCTGPLQRPQRPQRHFTGAPQAFPGGPVAFRPMGPWNKHSRLPFGGPVRPAFHPHFHGGFNPRMGRPAIGPNRPMLLPYRPMSMIGAMNPLRPTGPLPPMMMEKDGLIRPDLSNKRLVNLSSVNATINRAATGNVNTTSALATASGLSYQAETSNTEPTTTPTSALNSPLNINHLFRRLVETGILPSPSETKKKEEDEHQTEIIPVSFDKAETLKRQPNDVVAELYSGMQCSSCCTRFAPEMASKYSQHLDWHFRQNRKQKNSARKAPSRAWYCSVNEWNQSEEMEDPEDRPQSWFEKEKQAVKVSGSNQASKPSVATRSVENAFCEVCKENFDEFYNEEKEEWHLRPAIIFEAKIFHPLCLQDHKV